MQLKTKASLLFLISCVLFFSISFIIAIPYQLFGLSENLLFFLNAAFVSIPAFLIPSVVFRRVNRFPLFKAPKFWQIALAVVIGVGCINMNQSLSYFNGAIFYNVDISANSTTADTVKDLSLLNMLFSLAIIPPISEEFLMRGTLLESWRRYSPVGAMILTSLLFALLHTAPSAFFVYFAIGMLLALVYLITRNVWLTVIIHFINNLSSVIAAMMIKSSSGSVPVDAETDALSQFLSSRAGYLTLGCYFLAIAIVLIAPAVLILRSACRRKKLGRYAETAPAADENGELAPLPAPQLNDGALANGNNIAIWEDFFLWGAIDALLVMNLISGLSEFGILPS